MAAIRFMIRRCGRRPGSPAVNGGEGLTVHWQVYPEAVAAAAACADFMVARLEQALSLKDYATLALSGGTTPKPLFDRLASLRFPWHQVHFFWADERAVPPTDPLSNYKLAAEALLLPAKVPQQNVHRIHGELMPDVAARAYEREIRDFFGLESGEMPPFDLVHRGIGPDGHTASLFPGDPFLEDRERIAAAVYAEKVGQWRVTLLPGVLEAARETVLLVAGVDKAEPVRAIFNEPYDPKQYPGQLGMAQGRSVTWFLDQAAARLLESPE